MKNNRNSWCTIYRIGEQFLPIKPCLSFLNTIYINLVVHVTFSSFVALEGSDHTLLKNRWQRKYNDSLVDPEYFHRVICNKEDSNWLCKKTVTQWKSSVGNWNGHKQGLQNVYSLGLYWGATKTKRSAMFLVTLNPWKRGICICVKLYSLSLSNCSESRSRCQLRPNYFFLTKIADIPPWCLDWFTAQLHCELN